MTDPGKCIGAERFLSWIKTTSTLRRPHILPLFDAGAADSEARCEPS